MAWYRDEDFGSDEHSRGAGGTSVSSNQVDRAFRMTKQEKVGKLERGDGFIAMLPGVAGLERT
jgi:hypothetical protein